MAPSECKGADQAASAGFISRRDSGDHVADNCSLRADADGLVGVHVLATAAPPELARSCGIKRSRKTATHLQDVLPGCRSFNSWKLFRSMARDVVRLSPGNRLLLQCICARVYRRVFSSAQPRFIDDLVADHWILFRRIWTVHD